MKKRSLWLFILIIMLTSLLSSCFRDDYDMTADTLDKSQSSIQLRHILDPDSEVRGVWIASVYNIDYPSRADLSAEELKSEIDSILDTCEKNKLNTIFFQVRPSCDALYDSDIFPVSGSISTEGKLVFDPLEYIVREAHQRNIFIHAWVNPLRVTMNTHDISSLDDKSPAKLHPDWTVAYDDGKLYLNAGMPEVRELVADGVREIVSKYDVDGIVFDDYFYPYPVYGDDGKLAQFDDAEEYEKYGADFDNVADWRRDNINKIIRSVYDTVHETDPECVFGVSPFAIWQNNNGENGGSDTNGFEAYNSLYCDAAAWIDGGCIDYISPQIYWTFDDANSAFDILVRWWNAVLDGSNVKLYVSHASYRYEDGNWDSPAGQLTEQVSYARSEKAYRGSIFYGYDEINRNINGASDDIISAFRDDIVYTDIQSTGLGVVVASPASGSVMTSANTYILGSADPYYPLTMNGEKISQTKSGIFNMYVTLEKGENSFVFEQNGMTYVYTLTYDPDTAAVPTKEAEPLSLDNLSIVNTYPAQDVATHDRKIYVSCTAPEGAAVKVNIGGVETELTQETVTKHAASGYTGVTYSGSADLPETAVGEIKDCGNIKFTLVHRDGTTQADGPAVRSMGENTFIKVRAKNDYTQLKITENSSYYNDYTVQSAGMEDVALSLWRGMYKLRMGGYVYADDMEELGYTTESTFSTFSSAKVTNNGRNTEFSLACDGFPAYNGCIDENGKFVVTFYGIDSDSAPDAVIEKNPLLTSCETVKLDGKVRYSFELYDTENFYGFDLDYRDGNVIVSLRNPISVDTRSSTPLDGINIVLDAGHGGDDRGAAGALPDGMNEKDLNLKITLSTAEKLEKLGADVTLTRSGDTTLDLFSRMAMLEELEPDLCVSIHQNSMNYTSDVTRVRGTLGLWCMDGGRLLARCVSTAVADSLGRYWRGSQYQMLAMCRNPKFPEALIETGFITSAEEYEQLMSESGIERAAEGFCNGILDWFSAQSEYLSA